MSERIPVAVVGATGYVGGELLRLLAAHPRFVLDSAVSTTSAGGLLAATFPTLAAAFPDSRFISPDDALARLAALERLALFSAAPHGASAALVARFIDAAEQHEVELHVVDVSADFRYHSATAWSAVYGQPHGAPDLLDRFQQGLPEHVAETTRAHVGHPGCFATAALLAAVPLCRAQPGLDSLFVSGITGSTGSGRSAQPGTHHPERHANLYAYKPLAHRHAPEIESGVSAAGGNVVTINFVPHSGPFARGIHVTLAATLPQPMTTAALRALYAEYYAGADFVRVVDGTPRLKDVVTSNYAHVGVAAHANQVVVFCVIDNLVKGAAGGAMQWMNRLWSLPEATGLNAPAPAWT